MLTNKYAEGYPGRRWYGGCEQVDKVELLAIERAKQLFGAEHANVQPHSGSQANFAVYTSVLQPGDKVLGMNLSHGGHLTHGNPANFSGKLYQFVPYGVREDNGLIDYDELAASRAAREAEDDHRRRQRLLAHHRLRPHGRDRPQRRRATCSPTSRTSPASSPPASTPRPCRTPILSPPPRTRRCAARAAA